MKKEKYDPFGFNALSKPQIRLDEEEGDEDDKISRKAKNAVNNALNSGKLKKPDKCGSCKKSGSVEAHHHKGHDEANHLNVVWLCRSCHIAADVKLRKKNKKDGEEMKTVSRADFLFEEFMTEKFDRTPEGFLAGKAVITNVGVFRYINADGEEQMELRLPEEVFDFESVQSLRMSPLTNNHPTVPVTSENAKELSVGFIGDGIERGDGYHLAAPVTVTDADAVGDVQGGKRALSAGYTTQLDFTPGNWMGMNYDAIQRKIRYNHVAIVDRGRAGDDAVMKLDSIDAYGIKTDTNSIETNKIEAQKKNSSKKEDNIMEKTTKIDGVEYKAEAEVIKALTLAQTKIDELEKNIETMKTDSSKIEGERDSFKDEVVQLKKDKEATEKLSPEKIDEAVKAKLILRDTAKKFDVEVKDEMSDGDIKKAVVIKAFPTANDEGKLDKAEEVYVQARFDTAVEYLTPKVKTAADENLQTVSSHAGGGGSDDKVDDSDPRKHRADMIDRLENGGEAPEQVGAKAN